MADIFKIMYYSTFHNPSLYFLLRIRNNSATLDTDNRKSEEKHHIQKQYRPDKEITNAREFTSI